MLMINCDYAPERVTGRPSRPCTCDPGRFGPRLIRRRITLAKSVNRRQWDCLLSPFVIKAMRLEKLQPIGDGVLVYHFADE